MKQLALGLFLAAFSCLALALPEYPVEESTPDSRTMYKSVEYGSSFDPMEFVTKKCQETTSSLGWSEFLEVQNGGVYASFADGSCYGIQWYYSDGRPSYKSVYAKVNFELETVQFCPPQKFPTYTHSFTKEDGSQWCRPSLVSCPAGYFKYQVSGQCVPIQCAESGTMKSFWADTSLITSNQGIYCDGTCAYQITPDSSGFQGGTGNVAMTAASLGSVCGRGPEDDWYQQASVDSSCETETTEAGNQFMSCTDLTGYDPESGTTNDPAPPNAQIDDTVTMTDQKVDKTQIQDYDPSNANLENCDPSDSACEARNIVPALVDLEKYRQEQEADRHNKAIEAKEKEAGYLVEAINNLRKSNAANAKYLAEHSGGGARAEANVDLDGLIDTTGVPDGTGIQGSLDGAGSGVDSKIDELMQVEQFTLTASDVDYVDKLIAKLQLTGQCQISWALWGHSINFDYCEASEKLRPLVNFFIYFTTIFTIFYRVTGSLKLRGT